MPFIVFLLVFIFPAVSSAKTTTEPSKDVKPVGNSTDNTKEVKYPLPRQIDCAPSNDITYKVPSKFLGDWAINEAHEYTPLFDVFKISVWKQILYLPLIYQLKLKFSMDEQCIHIKPYVVGGTKPLTLIRFLEGEKFRQYKVKIDGKRVPLLPTLHSDTYMDFVSDEETNNIKFTLTLLDMDTLELRVEMDYVGKVLQIDRSSKRRYKHSKTEEEYLLPVRTQLIFNRISS